MLRSTRPISGVARDWSRNWRAEGGHQFVVRVPVAVRVMSAGLPDRRRRFEAGSTTVLSRASRLRERDDFLGEVQAILDGTWAYPTGAIVIEGVPGSGKTAMVNAGCHLAGDLSLRVLKARGEEGDHREPPGGAAKRATSTSPWASFASCSARWRGLTGRTLRRHPRSRRRSRRWRPGKA